VRAPRAASDSWGGVGQPAPVPGAITGPVGTPAPVGSVAAAPATAWNAEEARARLQRLTPFLLVAVVLLVAILTITPWPVGVFEDDAIYTVLAKALATGEGYRLINLPGAPHATHYPPGYPLVLAMLWRLAPRFPDNIVVFKFANAACLSLAALGVYQFCRRRLAVSPLLASGAALAGTLSVVVLLVTGVILSEPLFMASLIPALLLAERSARDDDRYLAFLSGAMLGVVALVRTLGAVAVPAAMLVLLLRRRTRAALALFAGASLLLVPWQLWVTAYQHEVPPVLTGKYGAYGSWLIDGYRLGGLPFAWSVVQVNVAGLNRVLGYLFMPVRASWPHLVAFLTLIGLFVGGLLALVRRAPVTVLFLLFYVGVIVLWPFEPDRFVLAVWPLLAVVTGAAILTVWRWRPHNRPVRGVRWAALTLSAAVVVGHVAYNVRGYRGAWWASVQRQGGQSAKPIVEWVAQHTGPDDVLSTEHDLIVYLYTGRRAVPVSTFLPRERIHPLSAAETLASVRDVIERYQPRYYITAWQPAVDAANALAAGDHPLLRRAGHTPNAFVFERIQP
jgi:hypothetical protein